MTETLKRVWRCIERADNRARLRLMKHKRSQLAHDLEILDLEIWALEGILND